MTDTPTTNHFVTAPPPTRRGPRSSPYWDTVADDLRSQPQLWLRLDLPNIPGSTPALKASNVFKALATRGLRVTVRRDVDTVYVFVLTDGSR